MAINSTTAPNIITSTTVATWHWWLGNIAVKTACQPWPRTKLILRRYDYGNYDKADGLVFAVVSCAMVLDFISGTVGAVIQHKWKSKIIREGLLHKCSLLLCVVLGADGKLQPLSHGITP